MFVSRKRAGTCQASDDAELLQSAVAHSILHFKNKAKIELV